MCDHPTCMEERGLAIKNRSDFKCQNIISVLKAIFDQTEGVNKEWRPELYPNNKLLLSLKTFNKTAEYKFYLFSTLWTILQ